MNNDLIGKDFWTFGLRKMCNVIDIEYAHFKVTKQSPKTCRIEVIECNDTPWSKKNVEELRECKPPLFKTEKEGIAALRKKMPSFVKEVQENVSHYKKSHPDYAYYVYLRDRMDGLNKAIQSKKWREALREEAGKYSKQEEKFFREALS